LLHVDFEWDCSSEGIVLDQEFNSDKLGWRGGDYFKLVNIDGRQMLVRVNNLEKFLIKGLDNE
jgi:hypothetical protein